MTFGVPLQSVITVIRSQQSWIQNQTVEVESVHSLITWFQTQMWFYTRWVLKSSLLHEKCEGPTQYCLSGNKWNRDQAAIRTTCRVIGTTVKGHTNDDKSFSNFVYLMFTLLSTSGDIFMGIWAVFHGNLDAHCRGHIPGGTGAESWEQARLVGVLALPVFPPAALGRSPCFKQILNNIVA